MEVNDDPADSSSPSSEPRRNLDRQRKSDPEDPPRYLPIFTIDWRIRCANSKAEDKLYLDPPWVVESGPYDAHLRGSRAVQNLELYLERNKEVAFIIYKDYGCCGTPPLPRSNSQNTRDLGDDASALLKREQLAIISPELRAGLVGIASTALQDIPHPNFEEDKEVSYPYAWWFHRRKEVDAAVSQVPSAARPYVELIRDYILSRMKKTWRPMDKLLSKGMISAQYVGYLFVPNKIIVAKKGDGELSKMQAFVIEHWLHRGVSEIEFSAWLEVSCWSFDGAFTKTVLRLSLSKLPSETEDFPITDLSFYPMEFASAAIVEALRNRGRMFWKCRLRNYVSYSTEAGNELESSMGSRFMVDIATHKQMHPGEKVPAEQPQVTPLKIRPEYMSQDNPDLDDTFFMCLPTTIHGFNMDKKEWVKLEVHCIQDVAWNTEAFDFVVIDPEAKELVRAVVANQIRTTENTDLIRGKGNGLFILLHGQVHLRAFAYVAEIAKRPLYRVSCGDIGTKAEDVEEYLDVVLRLGKTWGCVVLFDEADVFLEQRSLVNLERNALVSVFLRVLEYYEGILILTSNRVGIFDEAFKSRIQLNLRYKTLDRNQRLQIWSNFLLRLKRLESERGPASIKSSEVLDYGVNVAAIQSKVEELAEVNLNGREIRNAISTARHLTRYRKEQMAYEHLQRVINKATKFDEYLLELNKWFSPDEIRRDKRER
ncbi:hypothetical protein FZEAL_330 [Fusarium zealandicum]|uniref:ATPase AAA-type core domain-containing protein n=1 Tax=Fusarium zealandicum TaxID=1053134 RepID=A0A8H4UVD7_9HYPO|nr:hypothetical protein FZEAL_330 [Fusarium zealandicum]